jgi:hypothetical protein
VGLSVRINGGIYPDLLIGARHTPVFSRDLGWRRVRQRFNVDPHRTCIALLRVMLTYKILSQDLVFALCIAVDSVKPLAKPIPAIREVMVRRRRCMCFYLQ